MANPTDLTCAHCCDPAYDCTAEAMATSARTASVMAGDRLLATTKLEPPEHWLQGATGSWWADAGIYPVDSRQEVRLAVAVLRLRELRGPSPRAPEGWDSAGTR